MSGRSRPRRGVRKHRRRETRSRMGGTSGSRRSRPCCPKRASTRIGTLDGVDVSDRCGPRSRAPARTLLQRDAQGFDSALRLNVHLHELWPDGVFTARDDDFRARADFHEADTPSDEDIEHLARAVRHRVLRWLRKRGVPPADDPTATCDELSPLAALAAASRTGSQLIVAELGRMRLVSESGVSC